MEICNILDVNCNLNNFAEWVYSFFAPYLDPILTVIDILIQLIIAIFNLIISLIVSIFAIGISIKDHVFGFLYSIASIDASFTIIIQFLSLYVGTVVFIRVWNIIADLELWGFKLPKIPI